MYKSTIFTAGIAIGLLLITASCGNRDFLSDSTPTESGDALVSVNGMLISRQDVLHRINGNEPDDAKVEPSPVKIKKVLEGIVLQELAYQKAMDLGLDNDAVYQQQLLHLQTQLNDFKRKKLAEVFYRHEVKLKAQVSDAEAQAYASENASMLRSEFNVSQILRRDEKQIQQVLTDMKRGESFEAVAAKQFPDLPKSLGTPWELGYLNWEQIPSAWWNSLINQEVGQTSGIIRGPNRRFWVIKLVDKRDYANYSFESSKPKIVKILTNDKAKKLRKSATKSLRENANIVYLAP